MWLFYALSSFLVSNIVMIPLKDSAKTEIALTGKFIEKVVKYRLSNLSLLFLIEIPNCICLNYYSKYVFFIFR